ncbi:MAG TPA: prepilin peptidase [Bryobacterales bacterium]|nr:prepilin peptidase [Bryobacterales bacterium]
MHWLLYISILIGVLATAEDVYRRTISNKTTIAAFVLGLGAQTVLHGLHGAGDSLLGTAVGFLVFLIFFLLGGMGGGDIKLMASFGAVLGASQTFMAAILTAIVGALFALVYLLVNKIRSKRSKHATEREGSQEHAAETIPYAPAITLGVLLSFAAR